VTRVSKSYDPERLLMGRFISIICNSSEH